MKKIFLTILFLLVSAPAFAKVEVLTTYQYIQDITARIGKDKINVSAMANGNWDPHFIVPKPSLISKARKADLLIINGAQLEIGWLPAIIRQSNNSDIQTGTRGLLDLSGTIKMIQVPSNVSRASGDVHPQGNPHFILNPDNVPVISKAITDRLCQLDTGNCNFFKTNNTDFTKQFQQKQKTWNNKMKALSGVKVVEYHRLYDYFIKKYNLVMVSTIEPLPGIPPTTKHLVEVIGKIKSENVKFIMQDVYHPQDPAKFLSGKTNVKVILLPQDVGAVPGARDIFSLFDELVGKITE